MKLKRETLLVIGLFFILICISGIRNNQELKSNSIITSESDQDTFLEEITINAIGTYPHSLTSPLFELTLICHNQTTWEDTAFEIQENLAEIGIGVNVEVLSFIDYVMQINGFYDFDISLVSIAGGNNPDMSDIFGENGSLNLFGYHTSMDYSATLLSGTNQWYLDEGKIIVPPYTASRITHYWDWQDYLMKDLLPFAPGFDYLAYTAYWDNLVGYNNSDGLVQSWGKMSWSGTHFNQTATNEIVIADIDWTDLNPLTQSDTDAASAFVSDAIMDPLIWFDATNEPYPHIISDWNHINETHVRLTVREGLNWQPDPFNVYLNETVDVKDLYFTLFCQANITSPGEYGWIEHMTIVDDFTLDLFIDHYPLTPENEVFADYLPTLNVNLMPEHYLNQTQEADGITPDVNHSSWGNLSYSGFGTGPFQLDTGYFDPETNLTLYADSWWFNSTITIDAALDWTNRFGDFSGGLNQLRIKQVNTTSERHNLFEMGSLDLVNILGENLTYFGSDPDYIIQKKYTNRNLFFGYNLRSARGTPLQSTTLCPYDSSLTIGLAVRKAIAHAINRNDINSQVFNDANELQHTPYHKTMGVWHNSDVFQYDYDLDQAREYLLLAGFETGVDSDFDGLTDYVELSTTLTDRFDSDTDDDLMPDGWEIDNSLNPLVDDGDIDADDDDFSNQFEWSYGTDPHNNDTDLDGMTDGWEVQNLLNPLDDSDADENDDTDTLTNLEEFEYGTDPQNSDTDGDSFNDDIEINAGTDPLDPSSFPPRITIPEAIGASVAAGVAAAVATSIATFAIASNFKFRIKIPRPKISDSHESLVRDEAKQRVNLREFLESLIDELAEKIVDELCKCQVCETQAIGPFCYICGVKIVGMKGKKGKKIMSLISEGLTNIRK